MDFSQLSEENHDVELSQVFAKIDKIVSPKELKKVKQEKESLIVFIQIFLTSLLQLLMIRVLLLHMLLILK
jgi:hypothetical protein